MVRIFLWLHRELLLYINKKAFQIVGKLFIQTIKIVTIYFLQFYLQAHHLWSLS